MPPRKWHRRFSPSATYVHGAAWALIYAGQGQLQHIEPFYSLRELTTRSLTTCPRTLAQLGRDAAIAFRFVLVAAVALAVAAWQPSCALVLDLVVLEHNCSSATESANCSDCAAPPCAFC